VRQQELTSAFITLRGRLQAFASRLVGREEAEDVIQDAFVKLWSGQSEVRDEISARRLAFTSVRNSAIDSLRRRDTHPTESIDSTIANDSLGAETPDDAPAGYEEVREAVVSLSMKLLSERQREVFRLHDLSGWDYDEIADHLDMTQENVRMTLSRARKAIREMYKNQNS